MAVVAVAGMWLGAASAAAASDTITALCTSDGETQPCRSAWYTSGVTVTWDVSPPTSYACVQQSYVTDRIASPSCEASWPDGSQTRSYNLYVEVSTPTASAVPNRPPDSDGWYNHPVTAAVSGTAFSGISSCTAPTYAGPNSATAQLTGTCVDNAGKTAEATAAFRYDSTPPALEVGTTTGDRLIHISWRSSGDIAPLASVEVMRSPGTGHAKRSVLYRGDGGGYEDPSVRNGVRYRYTLVARDQAGNATVRELTAVPDPQLLAPRAGAFVSAPPLLLWTKVRRASYYNVQLYRGRKVLSEWPTQATMQLKYAWKFAGRRYRLLPGRYRWYVWPGFGRKAAGRYGPVIGKGTFVVTRPRV